MKVRGLIIKILVELVLTAIISILWLDMTKNRIIENNRLMSIGNDVIVKEIINIKDLYLISDNNTNTNINNIDNNVITIINNKNEDTYCRLLMIIDKKSSIDISYLRYKINNEVRCFDNLVYEDGANYYYLIDDIKLNAYENRNENFLMWLSDEYGDIDNDSLTYKIVADTKI